MKWSGRWLPLIAFVIALGSGLAAGWAMARLNGPSVEAHEFNGLHWDTNPILYRDITDLYSANVVSRRNDFNRHVSNVQIADAASATSGTWSVQIGDYNYNKSGWAGVCRRTAPQFTGRDYIDLNSYYMEKSSYSGNKRSAVVAHEMGHCFGGLSHHPVRGSLMYRRVLPEWSTYPVWSFNDPTPGSTVTTASEIDALYAP